MLASPLPFGGIELGPFRERGLACSSCAESRGGQQSIEHVPTSSGLRATVLVSSEIHCLVFVLASSSVVDVRLFGLHGYGIAGRRGVWRLSHAWNCQKMLGWSAMWSGDLTLPTTFFSCLMPPPPSQCGHICDNTAQGFIGVSCTSTLASPRVARFEPPASGLVSF